MARITLSSHWKFQRLARALGSKVLARGILETLWEPCWIAGDPYIGTSDDIEALCEWKGARGALTEALLMAGAKSAGFIEPFEGRAKGRDQHYQVHDFTQHCPDYVRRRQVREATAVRKCIVCGEEYLSVAPTSQVCSPRCRVRLYRERQTTAQENTDAQEIPDARNGECNARNGECNAPLRHPALHPPLQPVQASTVQASTVQASTLQASTFDKPVLVYVGSAEASVACNAPSAVTSEPSAVTSESDALRSEPAPVEEPASELHDKFELVADAPPRRSARSPRRAKSDPPPDISAVVLTFPVTGERGPRWHLREAQVERWASLYPTLDILAEARHALAWIEADLTRRKTFGGMAKFLVLWLNRSVNQPSARGPTMITGSVKTAGNQAAIEAFLRRRGALD